MQEEEMLKQKLRKMCRTNYLNNNGSTEKHQVVNKLKVIKIWLSKNRGKGKNIGEGREEFCVVTSREIIFHWWIFTMDNEVRIEQVIVNYGT